MVIRNTFLNHRGGKYQYRLHEVKLNNIVKFGTLRHYLNDMFINCPDKYFWQGPRSSSLRFNLSNLDIKNIRGHEVSLLTELALKLNKHLDMDAHSKVENFMLERDNNTIAVEVPLWLNNNELSNFKELFKTNEALTGHIDVLRIEDDKIWIWDYKPNAHREKFAATQTFFYALMLSRRTGIDLENFRCGYFDHNHAFVFKPEEKLIKSYSLFDFN